MSVWTLESIEESVSELGQRTELLLRVHGQRVAGDDAVALRVHDGDESKFFEMFLFFIFETLFEI